MVRVKGMEAMWAADAEATVGSSELSRRVMAEVLAV